MIELPIKELKSLYEEGKNLVELSELFGVSKQTLSRRLKEVGVTIHRNKLNSIECEDCGVLVISRAPNRLICDDCKKIRSSERNTARYRAGLLTPSRQKQESFRAKEPGFCAICGEYGKLHRDHDHSICEGRDPCDECARGFLCIYCNPGLGMFKDDPELLRKAADYLEKWNAR